VLDATSHVVWSKLLSHRCRGFSRLEHTPSAFSAACRSEVPYIEVDTRVSSDGEVFVYHDPYTTPHMTQACAFASTPAAALRSLRYTDGEKLLTLQEAVEIFAKRKREDQALCIDIKDFGFEQEHIRLVEAAGISDHVYFVSWIPQTLVEIHRLAPRFPLILSHWNLLRSGLIGRAACRAVAHSLLRVFQFVVVGRERYKAPLRSLSHGFQHAYFCGKLPAELATMLSHTGGGIGVHLSCVSDRLLDYCVAERLQLWVFSVGTGPEFLHYACRDGVDVVFCDNATVALQHRSGV